jgi:hypothetical protein
MKSYASGVVNAFCLALVLSLTLAGCGGGGDSSSAPPPPVTPTPPPVVGPAWMGLARDSMHTAQSLVASQPLNRISWQTPVDLMPQLSGEDLLIHYGSPVITTANTVLVPVKTGANGGFSVKAFAGADGTPVWSAASDYVLPPFHDWTPSYGIALAASGRLFLPGIGGKVYYRDNPDLAAGSLQPLVFFGAALYAASSASYDTTVFINTPITADAKGNIFFGFIVNGTNPAGLTSGIARIAADGSGSWVGATAASSDAAIFKVAMNSAPALSPDLSTLYAAVNTRDTEFSQTGYLLALDSTTLATKGRAVLTDPDKGGNLVIADDASSSPTVGPDGDVYFGALESVFGTHNGRGWLLHFDATLSVAKIPGSFGWDDTASIVPISMLPSYGGISKYLIATKYNNYGGLGTGDGQNKMAVLDPNTGEIDPLSGVEVMREIRTILGPTPDPNYVGGVKEWCVNTVAVDVVTGSILVNSEDGVLYRWDLPSNQFTQRIRLTGGIGEAYTPTLIGADGAVYSINNATLFSAAR